jgi:Major tropism determinant N-terminal domain
MSTVRIQVRRGLASEWTTANPVLAAGEMGVETNTNLFKFGNGTATWTALPYANNSDVAIGEISQDAINNALSLGAGLTKTYDDGANTITITVDTDVVSTKAFTISSSSEAQSAAIAAAATDATAKAGAAQSAAIAAAATDATAKANDALLAAEDYTDTAVNSINNSLSGYLEVGERGAAGGVASLDSNSKILQSELPLGSFTADISTTGNLSANNVTVTGNLAVNGTMTTINTENFAIEDTLLMMANANQSGMLDLGFVAGHNTGVFNHTGFVRDASEDKWKLFKGVTDEPTTTVNFAQGSLDALQVGRFESTEAVINNATLTGALSLPNSSIISQNIADEAVLVNHIADSSISAVKISDDAVTTDKIIDEAVTTEKIADDAITTVKILDSNITENKINNAAVTENKIASSAVTESKIADSSITTSKIADESITSAKVVSSAITSDKIANGSVTSNKIEDGSIASWHLSNNSVTSDKIENASVTSNKIANASVNADKLAENSISDINLKSDANISQSKIANLESDLDLLARKDSPTFTGTVVLPSTTSIGNLSSTEIGYLDGITSSVQTQIGAAATALSSHESSTTNVHGIADIELLATKSYADQAETDAIAAAGIAAENYADGLAANYEPANAVSTHNSATTSVHGIADTADLLLKSGGTMTGALTLSADPSSSLHAATKQYVDNTASGIVAKPQVLGATTANLDATYNNGTAGVGATLTHNTNGEFPAGAGGASGWAVGKGILVKNQTNKAQNGRYYISDMGSPSTPYVLTRCGYCDEASEIPGAYIFVQDGTNAGTGWIQVVADPATFVVGTDNIDVFQFSGSGTITAGTNISVSGNEVSVVATPSLSGIVFPDKTQTKAGVPSLTTIATERSSNTTLDALGTDAEVRDALVPLAGAVNVSFEATGNAKYAIGSSVSFYQSSGTGANITGSGITILSTPGSTLRTTASSVTATKVAATTWLLAGDLKA